MSKEVLFRLSWFNLSLLPWNMVKDNSAPKHQIIIAQIQKIGISQVVASDEDTCHQNGKPSFSASLQPFDLWSLLLYPTNTITRPCRPWKPVVWHWQFSSQVQYCYVLCAPPSLGVVLDTEPIVRTKTSVGFFWQELRNPTNAPTLKHAVAPT